MYKRNKVFGFIAILLVMTLIAGCTPETVVETVVVTKEVQVEVTVEVPAPEAPAEAMPEGDTILIGSVGPLSAPGSFQAGIEMRNATEMAVDEINEAGGVLGKQVELIFGDTEGLPERGTAVVERLITQNHVVGLTGEYHSGVGLTEIEVAHKYGVPFVQAETWADEITSSGYPEIFRIAPSIDFYSSIIVNYILEVGWKRIVFVVEDSDYGHLQAEAWTEQLAAKGVTEVEVFFADADTEDFTPILQRIQQDPPDMLAGVITGIGNSRMLRQACDLGLAPTAETAYYASVDSQYPEFWENVGDCGQYIFYTYVGLPESLWNEKTCQRQLETDMATIRNAHSYGRREAHASCGLGTSLIRFAASSALWLGTSFPNSTMML